ncbi:MAG: hypothetical protein HQL27_08715 [Candidatus Omnitrophica bacterium]|nr:hypothetical protein [Candidatus Omnitrophota bacterium]
MEKNCLCYKNYYYSGEEAKRFYSGQAWNEHPTDYALILECPECQTLWNHRLDESKDHLIIEKKFKRPELVFNKFFNLFLGKKGDIRAFYDNKVVQVFEDDKKLVLELAWDWMIEGEKIRYFLAESLYPGYLSDIYTIGLSSVEVNVGYLKDSKKQPPSLQKGDFIFKWQGILEKK